MKIVSIFNNKGGVGKSTLSYHLGCALGELGKKVLFIDLDPQCNLTINTMYEDDLEKLWKEEDSFIDDFLESCKNDNFTDVLSKTRSIHFLIKPIEDGANDIETLPPPKEIWNNTFIVPGRLSLSNYESKISERWNGLYQGDTLSIRTVTAFRTICEKYGSEHEFDYVIVDTSPSLGIMNKTIISTVDGFIIPTFPDMFSLYGIKNIGNSLVSWQREFEIIYKLISESKIAKFPKRFVQCIGFTIYNARKYASTQPKNKYDLANAHFRYAELIPQTILENIVEANRVEIRDMSEPIGNLSVMYSHNTYPSVAQALKCPMWAVPDVFANIKRNNPQYLELNSIDVNHGSFGSYKETLNNYKEFANDFILRADFL